MNSVLPRIRELAERSSSGTRVRLLWRQGTTVLWVEVSSPDADQTLAILVPPERALDAFHHPYAYAGLQSGASEPGRSSVDDHRQQTAHKGGP